MPQATNAIYIGTILLERNRWARPKTPTYRVSEWLDRFREAGFDGMELWAYHATGAPAEELAALEAGALPVAVLSSYCGFEDEAEADRRHIAELAARLNARGVKFNVGSDPLRRREYVRNLRAWADRLPEGCRPLCECHGGTIVEKPADAAIFFDEAGRERFGVIVHCFADDLAALREWFRHFGPAVAHAHAALRGAEGRPTRLDRRPRHVGEALQVLREEGYAGSFTLEFTEGTRAPDEHIEGLWEAAQADLAFLRERLS
jgi:sugar phosphate isomerase/epimerase